VKYIKFLIKLLKPFICTLVVASVLVFLTSWSFNQKLEASSEMDLISYHYWTQKESNFIHNSDEKF